QAGAKLDFDEMSAEQDTLALYHLHDNLLDDSGNGYDLVNYGTEQVDDGRLFVRSENDYLNKSLGTQSGSALTLEGWFKWNGALLTSDWGYIINFIQDGNNRIRLVLKGGGSGSKQLHASATIGGVGSYAVWTIPAGDEALFQDWFHIAGCFGAGAADGNGAQLWFNGESKGMSNQDTSVPSLNYTLRIGTRTGTSLFWNGWADEVRISLGAAVRYTTAFTPHRFLASGTLTSPTFDTERVGADWAGLTWQEVVPNGSDVTWQVRAADALDGQGNPDTGWSAWDESPASLPGGQHLQWLATLTSSTDPMRAETPTLVEVDAVSSERGCNIYTGTGYKATGIDYTSPYLRTGPSVLSIETPALAYPGVHWFGIRSVDSREVESLTHNEEIRLELAADGSQLSLRPAPVLSLEAQPAAGAKILLAWDYRAEFGETPPAEFQIFSNGGSGGIDYGTPVDTVTFDPLTQHYLWTSDALTDGTAYRFAVRAVTDVSTQDEGDTEVEATADDQAPQDVGFLTAEAAK
ncbi:MAG: hypothetical protein QGD94_08465, partial [Planctomycetia bacterium]|nr:hypothetical protein [Planctomycetia bacterium]